MIPGILICVVFLVFAALMLAKKLPTLFALPIMAILIGIIGGMPLTGENSLIDHVIVNGISSLAGNFIPVLISCWLSQIMYRTGVTSTIVKKAAELGGDKPFIVALALLAVSTFLFTVLVGTGAAAMVGAIALPLLMGVGIPAETATNLFLTALGAGYCINPANMSSIMGITGMTQQQLNPAALVCAAGNWIFIIIYMIVYFKKNGKKYAFAAPAEEIPENAQEKSVKGFRGFMACLTPLVVVVLTLVFSWNAIATFIIGVLWIVIFTFSGKWSNYCSMLVSSFNDGFKDGAPAVGLMFGIGMVLKAVGNSVTQATILPFMTAITPKTVTALVIMFCVLAPLSLYRGPMNVFGLGSGLLACITGVGTFSSTLLGAMFVASSRWSHGACPTATQVVWATNYVGLDPATCTKKVQLPNWVISIVTIIVVAIIYS